MGHPGFNRQWAQYGEQERRQHGGRRGGGPWGGGPWGGPGGFGRPGPPGAAAVGRRPLRPRPGRAPARAAGPPRRRPRRDPRRGAHRPRRPASRSTATRSSSRSPSAATAPGARAPARSTRPSQQLEDEGLRRDRRHPRPPQPAADRRRRDVRRRARRRARRRVGAVPAGARPREGDAFADLKPEIGQVMGAVWQIMTTGSDQQRAAAAEILADTRRRLYGLLADGDDDATTRRRRRPMSDEQLRIGDAEREQAAAALGEHYAQGRLTADEHAERLDQIWAARTRAELQPVFRDLPDPARRTTPARPAAAAATSGAVRAGRAARRLLLAVLAVLVVLTVLTHLPFVAGRCSWSRSSSSRGAATAFGPRSHGRMPAQLVPAEPAECSERRRVGTGSRVVTSVTTAHPTRRCSCPTCPHVAARRRRAAGLSIYVLLAPAVVLPLWVALYDRRTRRSFGFPFFFWFQFALILLAVALTAPGVLPGQARRPPRPGPPRPPAGARRHRHRPEGR